jgi:hypothetical protein
MRRLLAAEAKAFRFSLPVGMLIGVLLFVLMAVPACTPQAGTADPFHIVGSIPFDGQIMIEK